MNVLLISVDALRADHLGYMQNYLPNPLPGSVPPTPNIDELIKDSIRCTSMFATGGSTKMSFPSIMTGMYPPNTSLSPIYNGQSEQETNTMAQIFSAAGYETAGFHSNPFLADGTGFERGFDLFEDNQTTSWKFETMLRSRVQKYTEGTAVYRGLRKLYLRLRSATSTNIGLPYKPANELVEQVIG